jgi:hypothetical protein
MAQGKFINHVVPLQVEELENEEVAPPPAKKRKVVGVALFLGLDNSEPASDTGEDLRQTEVDKYMSLPQQKAVLASGVEASPLEWWAGHASVLPHLSKMARQFLAMPASSAGPERLFHAAGRLHDDLKKSTKDTTMEHVLNVYANT